MNTTAHDFDTIKDMRLEINVIFIDNDNKIKNLNAIHLDLVKTHVDTTYRFGLDSFHFQNRLIQIENENMKHIFSYIDNRIYCEYYKLYRIIYDYITNELNDRLYADKLLSLHKKFPIYKDLEPTKVYDFTITNEISNSINQTINDLYDYLVTKKQSLESEKKQSDMGINIHSLINEHGYKIVLLEEKLNSFVRYLNTFHSHHTKYLTRLISKLTLMNDIVNEDIQLKQNAPHHLNKAQAAKPLREALAAKPLPEALAAKPLPEAPLEEAPLEEAPIEAAPLEEATLSVFELSLPSFDEGELDIAVSTPIDEISLVIIE